MQGARCSRVAAAAAVAAPAPPLCLWKTALFQLQPELLHILYILATHVTSCSRGARSARSGCSTSNVRSRGASLINYAAAVAARSIAHLSSMGCVHWWAATFEFDEKNKTWRWCAECFMYGVHVCACVSLCACMCGMNAYT